MSDKLVFDTSGGNTEIKQEIPLFKLVGEDNPILKQVMPEFDFQNPPVEPVAFASSLVETCKLHRGIGLSANQCGFNYRVFVMGMEDNYVAFFNPQILEESIETVHLIEGCLSFPLLGLRITRPAAVKVQYQNFKGETKTNLLTGISARCFLHELDHMNGIVYTQRAKQLALKRGLEKKKKIYNKYIRVIKK